MVAEKQAALKRPVSDEMDDDAVPVDLDTLRNELTRRVNALLGAPHGPQGKNDQGDPDITPRARR